MAFHTSVMSEGVFQVVYMRKSVVVILAAMTVLAGQAAAAPTQKTKYKYYSVTGDTAPEIYRAMIRRGPDVNGVNAYASTSATSSQNGKLIAQGKSCRVADYQFNIDFTINLPKLKNEAALSGATAAKWSQFKSFLKTHEETHRSIWMGCAKTLESQVKALRTTDCKALDKQAANLWKKMRSVCDKKHAAFDAAEQKKLLKHPFVRQVMSPRVAATKTTKAAAAN
jgi:predicted secreted Zn-dependent protease